MLKSCWVIDICIRYLVLFVVFCYVCAFLQVPCIFPLVQLLDSSSLAVSDRLKTKRSGSLTPFFYIFFFQLPAANAVSFELAITTSLFGVVALQSHVQLRLRPGWSSKINISYRRCPLSHLGRAPRGLTQRDVCYCYDPPLRLLVFSE